MNLEASSENLYNNADSFAMAFDAAWKDLDLGNDKDIKIDEKITITFEKIKTHPFLIENPMFTKKGSAALTAPASIMSVCSPER